MHEGRSLRKLDTLPEWSDAVINVAAVADPDQPIALEALLLDRQHGELSPPEKIRWAPLVVMGLYTPACLLMFPRPLITLAAVIAFAPGLGFVYPILGICASAVDT